MVEFECANCGEVKNVNVLPGKHAVLGVARKLSRAETCCEDPYYMDSAGFRELGGKGLRELVSMKA
ncbi:MAG: hypothetical protein ABEJ83_04260 [Candidatus Nanohaloarchaea archaeon]